MKLLKIIGIPVLLFTCIHQCSAQNGSPEKLSFSKEGKWIDGFPGKIINPNTIDWHFPDSLDTRIYKKLAAAYDTVISFYDNRLKMDSFLMRHPQLYRIFQNDIALGGIDSFNAVNNLRTYSKAFKDYFEALKSSSNYSEAKKTVNLDYFPGLDIAINLGFSIDAKNQYGDVIKIRDTSYQSTTGTKSISFSVYRELRDNQLLQDHYKTNYAKYSDMQWILQEQSSINGRYKGLNDTLSKFVDKWTFYKHTGDTAKAIETFALLQSKNPAILKYTSELVRLEEYILQENREWIKCWLWFTNWEPILDPLNLLNPEVDKRMSELKRKIDSAKDNVAYITKFIENKNIQKATNFDELKKMSVQLTEMNQSIKDYQDELDGLSGRKKKFEDGLNVIKIEKQLFHTGELYMSEPAKWQHVRYHDYSRNFEMTDDTTTHQYYWDGDAEKIVVTNVPRGIKISLTEKIEPYIPKSTFSAALDPILDSLYSVLDANLAGLASQVVSLKPLQNAVNQQKAAENKKSLVLIAERSLTNDSIAFAFQKNFEQNKLVLINASIKAETRKFESYTQNLMTLNLLDSFELTDIHKKNIEKFQRLAEASFKKLDSIDTEQKRNKIILDSIDVQQTIVTDSLGKIRSSLNSLSLFIANTTAFIKSVTAPLLFSFNNESLTRVKKWFSLQSAPMKPYELATTDDTLFSSYVIGPKTKIQPGNMKNTYTIYKKIGKDEEQKVADWNYKRYETTHFDAIAGPVFTFRSRTSIIYDPASQTFSTEDIGSSDVLLGIKFFPFKTWIEDRRLFGSPISKTNRQRGISYLNRIAITAGVGVVKTPLKNFFTGFSYDLITGFAINYGWNFYTRKDYTLKNGAIEKEFESFKTTTYWGITISPLTLLKMLKIINVKP